MKKTMAMSQFYSFVGDILESKIYMLKEYYRTLTAAVFNMADHWNYLNSFLNVNMTGVSSRYT